MMKQISIINRESKVEQDHKVLLDLEDFQDFPVCQELMDCQVIRSLD
jgi:hypothetical protein